MGVDRNDPKTFINAGPPSQNLKAGIARSTGDDGSIYREIGKSGEGEGLPSFVASSPETKCLVKLKLEPRGRDISLSKPWSRFRWAPLAAVALTAYDGAIEFEAALCGLWETAYNWAIEFELAPPVSKIASDQVCVLRVTSVRLVIVSAASGIKPEPCRCQGNELGRVTMSRGLQVSI